ncbi:MAG: PDZ domain-containing protein [Chitinophagales bacterium]
MNKYLIALFLTLSITPSLAQNIGGIGAKLFLDTAGGYTMPRIMSLVPNSPADSNLKATDFIIKVNDISCKDKTIEEVVALIRGEAGTHVKITVADTRQGKHPREYDLVRIGLPGVAAQPPPDPVTAFYDQCEKEVQQLSVKRFTIIKTFNATCGDRYFNFEAERRPYHVRVMTMEDNSAGAAFYATARVFDNDDEPGATALNKADSKEQGGMMTAQSEGEVTFRKNCIGVVNVQMHGDITKCHAMYVIVYR